MRSKSNPGIVERHSRSCASRTGSACNCSPSYMAWAFDPKAVTHQRTCASRAGAGCDCTPAAGGKIYKTFSGKGAKSAAKQWRSDAVPAIRRHELRAPTRVTLREAWDSWIAAVERGEVLSRFKRPYKPSALRTYRADMERYVLPALGARRLADITADDVQALVERLNGQGLSGSKVRNVIVPLQALYRRNRRQVPIDPTDGDALDLPEVGGRRDRVAQVAETAALLEALPADIRPIYATAAYAGLRRGELRALRISDVNDVYLWVERSWDDKAGVIEPKSKAGRRHVPLPATLRAILTEHIERNGRGGDDLVFGRTATEPFTPSHVRRTAGAAYGLHELRHSYSSYLDDAGISETRADRYMGHSNPSVQARYRHQLEGQLADDAKRLDEYLTGAAAGKVVPLATGAHTGAQKAASA
jgi:integrase